MNDFVFGVLYFVFCILCLVFASLYIFKIGFVNKNPCPFLGKFIFFPFSLTWRALDFRLVCYITGQIRLQRSNRFKTIYHPMTR